MYGYIYETTNLINGKKYVGKHVSRTFDNKYYGSGTSFRKDFNKFGETNFKIRVLEKCNSNKELIEKETYYIKLFDAVRSPRYYNNSYGGESEGWNGVNKAIKEGSVNISRFSGKHHTEDSKRKISEALKGRPSPRRGTKISEKQRKAIIESNKRKRGMKLSEKARKNISDAAKGRILSDLQKHNIGKSMKNRKHITDGINNKFVKLEELDQYLSSGWRLGQTNRR